MKIAISIPTYKRSDGKTPFYLQRALNSIFTQYHYDFKVFVIGDHYEDEDELESIISIYPESHLLCFNLNKAMERSKYSNRKDILWTCGGVFAHNYMTDIILNEGFDYICHIDHDDYWEPRHLQVINEVITKTKADWVCTMSTFKSDIIPIVDSSDFIIPYLPKGCHLINSSTCYNYKTIPLRYRNVYEETGSIYPSDADLWDRIGNYISENKLTSYVINELTCYHEEEGFTNACR
jgi:hypothetical protein